MFKRTSSDQVDESAKPHEMEELRWVWMWEVFTLKSLWYEFCLLSNRWKLCLTLQKSALLQFSGSVGSSNILRTKVKWRWISNHLFCINRTGDENAVNPGGDFEDQKNQLDYLNTTPPRWWKFWKTIWFKHLVMRMTCGLGVGLMFTLVNVFTFNLVQNIVDVGTDIYQTIKHFR